MTKKVKTVEELLEKVNVEKLRAVGVNDTEIAKVEALHDALKQGKTWDDEEVQQVFGVLPDSYPLCTAYINTEILVRIGKAKPIKVISRPGIKDSRLRWILIEKADEYGAPASLPIQGYEIICAGCQKPFIGKEPFHQNFCSNCSGRKVKEPESKPASEPEPVKSVMVEPIVSLSTAPDKPKRRGRPPKDKADKKVSPRLRKSEKSPVHPTKTGKKTKKRSK